MNPCETREPCRMIPSELRPGDVVTRKPGLVVIGPVWSKPALYVVRDEDGSYRTLHGVECEPRDEFPARPAPETDCRDVSGPMPAFSIHDAETADPPVIEWNPEDSRGDFRSRCGRFGVVAIGGKYTVYDTVACHIRSGLALKADAIEWCERRVLAENTKGK